MISGMSLSPTSKSLFTITFIFVRFKIKHLTMELYSTVILILKLLNKPFASCSFTNLDFLNPHAVHFDLAKYLSYSSVFYNVGSIFSTKCLMCFNGLEMFDMYFNNSFAIFFSFSLFD